jgi:hypothetical protein
VCRAARWSYHFFYSLKRAATNGSTVENFKNHENRNMLKKETNLRNSGADALEDALDESEDYSGSVSNEPKRSPMRRKEKFRNKDFKTEKKHKNRKRNLQDRFDFKF